MNKAKLKREKAAIAHYFNDVEYNDDEEAQEHLPMKMKMKLQTKMFLRVKTQLNYLRARYQNENGPRSSENA